MFKEKRKRLGDLLVEAGMITPDHLNEALMVQKQTGKKLGEVLIDRKYVTQEHIIQVLEFQLGIPHVSLDKYDIDPEATKKISENLAKRHELIPIKIDKNKLIVAMSDPLNIFAIDDVRIFSGMEVQPVIATSQDVTHAIDVYYGKQEAIKAAEEYKKEYGIVSQVEKIDGNIEDVVNSAPIVKLVNSIIEQAIRLKASDIHIEPFDTYIRIRYRIDGQLEENMRHEIQLLPAIVTRIKITGEMNIAEKRKPQDGRISMMVDGNEFDLRVSILPTVHGEKVVIRITDKRGLMRTKEQLGFFADDMDKYNNILKSPHGMILVTGPTGSGKSTTLYTTVRELNKDSLNIITVEDPVEATIEGINQVQVNPKAGLDFAGVLRSILRQDPDIIMIGEIRDKETAEIAVRAAVTGHLVVSTLHTNDASSTISRLMDMNIDPFLISTSLVGIISQRLVRKICTRCKEEYVPLESELNVLGLSAKEENSYYRGKGCYSCNNTGYQGRIGVYEIMPVSHMIRQKINHEESSDTIREQAIAEGMSTLKTSCIRLVRQGVTTIDELIRVAYSID
ncbi:ATPase, T2SS/T4P/T4SS family [Petroclostridium sp. X23]|uniref:GspE/PulE family protein n=1 Tax=Petroclostridium sp. X23 TaxID=3045146 RepID=UPI0024AD07C2|nr:ATPase, T2SS/T4P/T4SS family [Petroclostridium sp. X23]WHH59668.1 ATPase, T2SS/T4P/T4SS family [Petroclostridium sp. X23]